jgi:hypothetical protein
MVNNHLLVSVEPTGNQVFQQNACFGVGNVAMILDFIDRTAIILNSDIYYTNDVLNRKSNICAKSAVAGEIAADSKVDGCSEPTDPSNSRRSKMN